MRKFGIITLFSLLGILFLGNLPAKEKESGETLAVATFTVGEVTYLRGGVEKKVTPRTIFYEKDVIVTKDGKVNIQVGPTAIVRLSPYSSLEMSKLYEIGDSREIALQLNNGRAYSKIVKKLDKDSSYRIYSPTLAAGVRGTEFVISEKSEDEPENEDSDVETGVYVNEGEVAVSEPGGDNVATLSPEEQVVKTGNDLKQGILDNYMKKKMEIFENLDVMKKRNYELLKKQKDRNKESIDRIREQNEKLKNKISDF